MFNIDLYNIKNIILILLVIGMIYLLFFKKTSENFGPYQADINQMISNTYQVDLNAMRKLGQISNNILTEDILTLTASNTNATNMKLSGNLVIEGNFILKNPSTAIGGSYDGYIIGPFNFNFTKYPDSTTGSIFTVPVTGDYLLTISASGMTNTGDIRIQPWINGINTMHDLHILTDKLDSHRTLPPISFIYTLNAGKNYLSLYHLAGYSDINDLASIYWIYSPVIV